MIAWMVYAALVGGIVAVGGWALERLSASLGRPRRFAWLAALTLAVVIPVAGRTRAPVAPPVREAISAVSSLVGGAPVDGGRTVMPALPVPGRANWGGIAALTWGAASLAALSVLGCVLLGVARRRRRWESVTVAGTRVYVSRRFGPALVGVADAKVVVPAWVPELGPGARDAIIRHEEQHARARDHLVLLYGGLAAALFPWSPAIWWMHRRLRAAVEMDCDERVLASGIGVADYGAVLLHAGTRSCGRWGFAPAMGQPRSLLERRLKMMSGKRENPGAGRAAMLACVVAGALVAACGVPLPTALGDAIDEVVDVHAGEARDGVPADGMAGWLALDPRPLLFVDDVRIDRYEDLPESVRRWSESGFRRKGLIDRVEVIKGRRAGRYYERAEGPFAMRGVTLIFTKDRVADEEIEETEAESPARSDRDNPWGGKFSGMAASQPLPLVYVDGIRVDYPVDGNATPMPDPEDIDRIEVVKGAAAVALYGDEAVGGVILVYTGE